MLIKCCCSFLFLGKVQAMRVRHQVWVTSLLYLPDNLNGFIVVGDFIVDQCISIFFYNNFILLPVSIRLNI